MFLFAEVVKAYLHSVKQVINTPFWNLEQTQRKLSQKLEDTAPLDLPQQLKGSRMLRSESGPCRRDAEHLKRVDGVKRAVHLGVSWSDSELSVSR